MQNINGVGAHRLLNLGICLWTAAVLHVQCHLQLLVVMVTSYWLSTILSIPLLSSVGLSLALHL